MCGHVYIKINDVAICTKCGLTIGDAGRCVIFDQQLINWREQSGKRKQSVSGLHSGNRRN